MICAADFRDAIEKEYGKIAFDIVEKELQTIYDDKTYNCDNASFIIPQKYQSNDSMKLCIAKELSKRRFENISFEWCEKADVDNSVCVCKFQW